MKKLKIAILGLTIFFFARCEGDKKNDDGSAESTTLKGMYVLNEGSWGNNNATLTYHDFETNTTYDDYFELKNHRKLGDVGNDIKIYGSKIYIVMNGSSRIEILDINGNFVDSIPLKTNGVGREPRCIAFYAGKAYVTAFDGTLIKIDTASLQVEGSIKLGLSPDGICVVNNKIYVANSGGKEYASGYDKTVSIVNPVTFTEVKKIDVAVNPFKFWVVNENEILLLSKGNYVDVFYTIQKISTTTDGVTVVPGPGVIPDNFVLNGSMAYCYGIDYANYTGWLKPWDITTTAYSSDNFITDGTVITLPNGIEMDKITGDVFVCDAISYQGERGKLVCIDKDGKKKYSFDAGINPSKILLIRK